eukprot:2208275-Alexandrium_andersonii.AAC.1
MPLTGGLSHAFSPEAVSKLTLRRGDSRQRSHAEAASDVPQPRGLHADLCLPRRGLSAQGFAAPLTRRVEVGAHPEGRSWRSGTLG